MLKYKGIQEMAYLGCRETLGVANPQVLRFGKGMARNEHEEVSWRLIDLFLIFSSLCFCLCFATFHICPLVKYFCICLNPGIEAQGMGQEPCFLILYVTVFSPPFHSTTPSMVLYRHLSLNKVCLITVPRSQIIGAGSLPPRLAFCLQLYAAQRIFLGFTSWSRKYL